jgi:hypothetical protein
MSEKSMENVEKMSKSSGTCCGDASGKSEFDFLSDFVCPFLP